MRRHSYLLIVVICLALHPFSPASAYTVRASEGGIPLRWDESLMPIPYYIERGGPGDVPDEADIAAIQSAFQTWENVAAGRIQFQFAGLTERGGIDPRASVVMWMQEEWPYDSCYVAKTRLHYDRERARILRVEIILNGRDYRWSTNGESGTLDVQNVATHEVGHFIGLGDEQLTGRTMFEYILQGESDKSALSDDDIDGAHALYPLSAGDGTLRLCLIEYDGAAARLVEDNPTVVTADEFVSLCPRGPDRLPGILRASGGGIVLSVLGPGGGIAREYAIPSGNGVHPGRIRAASSFGIGDDGTFGVLAAVLSLPGGRMIYLGALPGDGVVVGDTVLSPVRGADDLMAFAPLSTTEPGIGDAVVAVEKRRNSDFYISIVRGVALAGGVVELSPLRLWRIPDCASVVGVAAVREEHGGGEIVVLLRNGAGRLEIATYPAPFAAYPTGGDPTEPAHRSDASACAVEGKPLAISALHPEASGVRQLLVVTAPR